MAAISTVVFGPAASDVVGDPVDEPVHEAVALVNGIAGVEQAPQDDDLDGDGPLSQPGIGGVGDRLADAVHEGAGRMNRRGSGPVELRARGRRRRRSP